MPAAPQAVSLQGPGRQTPVCQARFGQARVSAAAGLVAGSQGAPPHAGGEQVTLRPLLCVQAEPSQAVHWLHAPVSHTPLLAPPPVQGCDESPVQSWPPHAGAGLVQERVRVPPVLQSLAEHWLQADQPPSTGVAPVQARVDGPVHSLPPHPGTGLLQVRVCVPAAPQDVAEQAPQSDQPPFSGVAPVQGRTSSLPLVPSSLRQLRCPAGGSVQVRVCLPLMPQALDEQALQADQPSPGSSGRRTHFSEFWPPCRPSQRHTWMVGWSGNASSFGRPAAQPLRTLSSHTPSTATNLMHFWEFCPPWRPSQRHTYTVG